MRLPKWSGLTTITITTMMLGCFASSVLFCSLYAVTQQEPRKTKRVTVEEVIYLSRECPDDVVGTSPTNHWYVSVDGTQVTASCEYLDWDNSQ